MNAQEFKAWFDGFTEDKKTLTETQLKRVREEVVKISLLPEPKSTFAQMQHAFLDPSQCKLKSA